MTTGSPQTHFIRDAQRADLPAILAIYNDAVETTTAIWNDAPASLEERTAWYDGRIAAGYPVLVAETGGTVAGYATFGPFRPFHGFRHTAELSVYVERGARGGGIGSALLGTLVERAGTFGLHVLVAGIEAGNEPSIALHRRHGFVETGRMPEVGRKFDRWLDLVFMQRRIGAA